MLAAEMTVKGWSTNNIQKEKFAIYMRGGVIDPIISENRMNGVYMPFYAKGRVPLRLIAK